MDFDYKVDAGIEPPQLRVRRKYPWPEMKVGDSFFIPVDDARQCERVRNSAKASAGQFRARHNRAFETVSRKIEGGLRIWRVK